MPVDDGPGDRAAFVLGRGQQIRPRLSRSRRNSCPASASGRGDRHWPAGPAPAWRPARPAPWPAPGAARPATPAPPSAAAGRSAPPGSPAPGTSRRAAPSPVRSPTRRAGWARRWPATRRARCPARSASAFSTDSLASRLPFSISDSADGEIDATAAAHRPASVPGRARMCRNRRPIVNGSAPVAGRASAAPADEDRSRAPGRPGGRRADWAAPTGCAPALGDSSKISPSSGGSGPPSGTGDRPTLSEPGEFCAMSVTTKSRCAAGDTAGDPVCIRLPVVGITSVVGP